MYSSIAVTPFSEPELDALLVVSRANNARSGVTGMLLYRDGRFLQVLEGPEASIRQVMERIQDDSGHHSVRTLLEDRVTRRQFPDWTMGFPQVDPDDEDRIPGYRTTFEDLADEWDDVSSTTPAVRELLKWFQGSAI